jgi:phosphonate transport system substrate-binding protein
MQTKLTPRHIRQAALSVLLLVLAPSASAEPAEEYSFGIGPQQAATELAKRWMPIMRYLSEKSGVGLQFRTAKDIPTFQQQMKEGAFDFAFINPYHYTLFHKAAGYDSFAREKEGTLVGVLVVKKDSLIKSVMQLNGQTIAFPAPSALAATWLPLRMLEANKVAITPQYVNSMDSVYRSVAKGLVAAGGGEMRTYGTIDPEVKQQLRVLWRSDALPPFTFAAHPRVPKDAVAKVQKAMEEMDRDPQGQVLLKGINFKGMEIAKDEDYNAMRAMNIKPMEAK